VTLPEVWLRGALPDVPALLQPVAHGLLQSREEVRAVLHGIGDDALWVEPGGAASLAYHARHAIGSLERLLTYARGEQLSPAQLEYLRTERTRAELTAAALMAAFDAEIERALVQVRRTSESSLLEPREVGRAKLPSTVIGLLFHAAEHTQRHVGQMTTTARVVRARIGK
jgi:uncharacterized damage-inducible protein DinB